MMLAHSIGRPLGLTQNNISLNYVYTPGLNFTLKNSLVTPTILIVDDMEFNCLAARLIIERQTKSKC